jgi:rubredoxin
MVSPGKLNTLTALMDGSITAYEPSIDPESSEIGYPDAAQYLHESDGRAFEMLESLARRGILGKTFEEKTYICPDCRAEGIQYTTVCPDCGSAYAIGTELFEHLTCGHVAPRAEFETYPDEFVCPECEEALDSFENVGHEERYVCQDCESYFKTPEHGLWCRGCADIYVPDETIERVLCRYTLTDAGQQWVETQLAARESLAEMLTERGFNTDVNTVVQGKSGTEYPVQVFATDTLLNSRVVAAVHEHPDGDDATALREVATDIEARPILVTTLGTVSEQPAALADQGDIHILHARTEGSLIPDYEVTTDRRTHESLVQRLASAVK